MSAGKEQAVYSHGHHSSVVQDHARRTATNSIGFLVGHIQAGDRVLDIGCGPGTISVDVAELVGAAGSVTGVDAVETVLAGARELAGARGVSAHTTFQTADANALPFGAAEFDVVYCHQVLQHVKEPVGVLREMRRVCRPGGLVAAREADYKSFAWYPEPAALGRWADLYQAVARANGGEPNAGRYVQAWAREAGLIQRADPAPGAPVPEPGSAVFSWDTWLYQGGRAAAFGESWAGRTLHSGFATTATKHALVASAAELEQLAQAWAAWARDEGRWIAIPNGEIICRLSLEGEGEGEGSR